ncbi:hypothetical protein ATANTOWER_027754 [Ataeniobius toweri]|uniref:Uncharacterized protein n=1 Tax=Ataeniobius toweri TaxID=208326 RepID=A0ABU7A370_9TELE|nr:hypothetical protein [Ataeniobius toweri]
MKSCCELWPSHMWWCCSKRGVYNLETSVRQNRGFETEGLRLQHHQHHAKISNCQRLNQHHVWTEVTTTIHMMVSFQLGLNDQ